MSKPIHNWLVIEKLIRKQAILINKYQLARYQLDVLECLGLHYNPDSEFIYPKQATIAEITGIQLTNVNKALKKLELSGLISSYKTDNHRKQYKLANLLLEELGLKEPSIVRKSNKELYARYKERLLRRSQSINDFNEESEDEE